jgi:signal peptidase I
MGQSRPSATGPQDEDPLETGNPTPTVTAGRASTVPLDRTEVTDQRSPEEPDTGESEESPGKGGDKKGKKAGRGGVRGFFGELPGLILIAFVLALVIKSFLVQAFFIPSQSMVPTLRVGDRVLVNKLVYDFGEPQRLDVIVFENPNLVDEDQGPVGAFWDWLTEGFGFSADPQKDFIKRVIGLPGETIEVRDGTVLIDGKAIEEPYVHRLRDRSDFPPTVVKDGHVFVMGDNRPNSQDSRSALGQIPYEKIVGKAFVLLWPPSRIEWLSDD